MRRTLASAAPRQSFAYDITYRVVDLGVLTPGGTSAGVAVSTNDRVAGYGLNALTNTIAATTDMSNQLVGLGTLPSGRTSSAYGISPGGVVVGGSEIKLKSSPDIYGTHAFISPSPGTMIDIHDPSINLFFPNTHGHG